MKILTLSLLPLLLALTADSQPANNMDVLHYRIQIELSDASDSITSKAEIKIHFPEVTDQLILDLTSAANGKGMTVVSVIEKGRLLEAIQRDDHLTIKLPVKTKAGDESTFTINYKGIPADGLIISKNKFGHRTFFADNWPNRGHNWIPCHDDPADKASVEFIVTAPQHYQVIANGLQVEETNLPNNLKLTHWKEEVPISTKVMAIGAADFAVNLSGFVNCIPVYSWVYPEERDKGFFDYAQATEILPFFISNVGPYGYKKLANVESKTTFGGLENANTIFYSEKSITGTRQNEDLLAHEIAHQWFGNMATEKSFAHLWLSEGFATYFTILYFENKYGLDTARQMLKKDREETIAYSKESNHPVVDEATIDYMQLLNANSYQKGGWVLHMLRRQLGDTLFWRGIREYYAEYAGKNADTDDLRKIFEKVSGKNLQSFFTQWLYTAGQPQLNISWKTAANKKLLITIKQLQESPFTFPLEIELHTNSGKTKIEKLNITKKEETFPLNVSEKIVKLVADPDINLLFEGK
ncbi:MAG: family peptidase [Chitinophagaceae bacterium]|nr:family peptidase [Chitinophagaceae bacterium]